MDVYYNKNFWHRETGAAGKNVPLRKISVDAAFCWKDMEGFIPALYVGSEGAVLDVCIRVPFPKIESFFEKWKKEKRLSGLTDEEIEEILKEFEMDDKQDKLGNELSKGMMQKVSICCALAVKPKVILLDEPMVGLDPAAIRMLKEVVLRLRDHGVTVLISTHMLEMVDRKSVV